MSMLPRMAGSAVAEGLRRRRSQEAGGAAMRRWQPLGAGAPALRTASLSGMAQHRQWQLPQQVPPWGGASTVAASTGTGV